MVDLPLAGSNPVADLDPAKLHCIYDPYCGWCYGAAPLLAAARKVDGLPIELHGGGMMAGNNRKQMTPDLRDFILQHDQRIAAMTGQPFGPGYRELLDDTTAWLDSTPPTMAIAVAGQFGKALEMLDAVQQAHFLEGRRIAEARVLIDLAQGLDIPRDEFTLAFAQAMQAPGGHIRESRELLARVGGQGFPTFVFEKDGQLEMLPSAQYLGKPEAWREMLARHR
jgi:putative protein-disulfide isomerase